MKTIKINIDDNMFKELMTQVMIKRKYKTFFGPMDEFSFLVIDSVIKEKIEIWIGLKEDKKE